MTEQDYHLPFVFQPRECVDKLKERHIGGLKLVVTHENGLEGQTAYGINLRVRFQEYAIEFVQYPNYTWAYHLEERKGAFICDSRITNTYFGSFFEAKQKVLQKIAEHYWKDKK